MITFICLPIFCIFLNISSIYILNNALKDAPVGGLIFLQLITLLLFLLSGVAMGYIIKKKVTQSYMYISIIISILLFLISFNTRLFNFSFFNTYINDYLYTYSFIFTLWSGIYFYKFITLYKSISN